MHDPTPAARRRPPHPIVFLVLYLPFGIVQGYVTVTLGYVLRGGGVSVETIAGLVGLSLLPNTWKVLWAPLVDTTLTARTWFAIGAGLSALVLLAAAAMPMTQAGVPMLGLLCFLSGVTSSFAGIAADRVMAYATPREQQGRAGGWSQAGNLGGQGLGGGLGLWLCQHASNGIGSAGTGVLCLVTLLILPVLNEEQVVRESFTRVIKDTGRDLAAFSTSRMGLLACFICLLPIGTGGLANIWGAVGRDWRASADQVALISGVLSGVVSVVGSLAGGYLCDRMDRKAGYILFGLMSAACGVAMALGPRTPMAFLIFATLYNLILGGCYGAFAALTLEAIGHGAAATKYTLVASISNVPIMLMTLVDGISETRRGASGMLYVEAGFGVAAAALFYAVLWLSRGWSWDGLKRRFV
jgi:MFS family permease